MCRLASQKILMEIGDATAEMYWDDAKGGWLDPKLVSSARETDMRYIRNMQIYYKVDGREAYEVTGKPPIRVRWVDTNKGSKEEPNIRCRLVAMEFRRGHRPELFSATPPLEAVGMLVADLASRSDGGGESNP